MTIVCTSTKKMLGTRDFLLTRRHADAFPTGWQKTINEQVATKSKEGWYDCICKRRTKNNTTYLLKRNKQKKKLPKEAHAIDSTIAAVIASFLPLPPLYHQRSKSAWLDYTGQNGTTAVQSDRTLFRRCSILMSGSRRRMTMTRPDRWSTNRNSGSTSSRPVMPRRTSSPLLRVPVTSSPVPRRQVSLTGAASGINLTSFSRRRNRLIRGRLHTCRCWSVKQRTTIRTGGKHSCNTVQESQSMVALRSVADRRYWT